MVVEYIRYTVSPERSDEFRGAYARAQGALASSEHCLGWEVSQGIEEPENFIVRIEWDSVDGHEHGFRASPEFQSFLAAVRPFFGDIQEMKHYQLTEVAGRPS